MFDLEFLAPVLLCAALIRSAPAIASLSSLYSVVHISFQIYRLNASVLRSIWFPSLIFVMSRRERRNTSLKEETSFSCLYLANLSREIIVLFIGWKNFTSAPRKPFQVSKVLPSSVCEFAIHHLWELPFRKLAAIRNAWSEGELRVSLSMYIT